MHIIIYIRKTDFKYLKGENKDSDFNCSVTPYVEHI